MKRFLFFTLIWFLGTTIIYLFTARYFAVVEGWNWRAIFMGYIAGPLVGILAAYLYQVSLNRSEYVQPPVALPQPININFPDLPKRLPEAFNEKEGGESRE